MVNPELSRMLHKPLNLVANMIGRTRLDPSHRYVWYEGGQSKKRVYGSLGLKGKHVCAVGIGKGQDLVALAREKPGSIVAVEPNPWPEWIDLELLINAAGTKVSFQRCLLQEATGRYDAIISDAVLEHVTDLPGFMAKSYEMLWPGGLFSATFGPIWYGPNGDHRGPLPPELVGTALDPANMTYSKLRWVDYLRIFRDVGFKTEHVEVKLQVAACLKPGVDELIRGAWVVLRKPWL